MLYRPLEEADFPGAQVLEFELLHQRQQSFLELPERERQRLTRTGLAALRFYARSEHSFACVDLISQDPLGPSMVLGFVLAQSVWLGDRAMVWISSVQVHPDAPAEVLPGLLHAVTKSAYDAAVYELHFAADKHMLPFAEREGYVRAGLEHVVRLLGARSGAGHSEGE